MNMHSRCPHCERGELESHTIEETIRYGGSQLAVPGVEISVCPVCSEELVLPEQAKANEVLFADAKRRHDGLLTSGEIVSWRKRHRLSQADAAMLLGGGVNAFSKYERGEVMQSKAMDLLMRAAQTVPGVLPFLMAEANYVCARNVSHGWEAAAVVVSIKRSVKARTVPVAAVNEAEWRNDHNLELVVNG